MMNDSQFNEIFDRIFGGSPNTYYRTSVVTKSKDEDNSYEVNQTKDGAYLFFEAPGFNKSNLKVEMESGVLLIEGKRTYKINGEEKTKSISKEFKIGSDYDPSSIEATIEDGLLTVFVPNYKKQEKKRINLL
jgi:HSP20 family molecular chaperone IbpA